VKFSSQQIQQIAAVLARGGLVVAPSDTIYGILADARNSAAVRKLHSLRARPRTQGLIILADSLTTVAQMVDLKPEIKAKLTKLWPNDQSLAAQIKHGSQFGATTVVLRARALHETWLEDTRETEPRVAFRVPSDSNMRELLRATGPLVAPSANLHGSLPARNISEAKEYFGDQVDLYIDGGEIDGTASRMIEFDHGQILTLRDDGRRHPEDKIITRRRKLYKFARFDEMPSAWQLDEWKTHVSALLSQNFAQIVMELGAGSAQFSVELARQNPDNLYLAVDVKSDRLYQGARRAHELNLKNIQFIRAEISHVTEIVTPRSVDAIWLTFPDPHAREDYQILDPVEIRALSRVNDAKLIEKYLRKSDAKHRLTDARFLKMYAKLLREKSGILYFKTDNLPLFAWSENEFRANGWTEIFATRDLHGALKPTKNLTSTELKQARIMTAYETEFFAQGITINFAKLVPSEHKNSRIN
jgi:tRNA threonylcarbamoyl adenosine modification protein (Sua5/YciO/YrdC/YwlC family)